MTKAVTYSSRAYS